MTMSRLKYYRMEAGLSVAQLARLAQVDETTCRDGHLSVSPLTFLFLATYCLFALQIPGST